jgi:hypothetical protein
MITPMAEKSERAGLVRVTVTLDSADVELLDRLATLDGGNRSSELRSMLQQMRPTIRATVEAFEGAMRAQEALTAAAGSAEVSKLQQLLPEAERLQDAYLGALARIEGLAAAAGEPIELPEDGDPRPSNHGGHTPTPTTTSTAKKRRRS